MKKTLNTEKCTGWQMFVWGIAIQHNIALPDARLKFSCNICFWGLYCVNFWLIYTVISCGIVWHKSIFFFINFVWGFTFYHCQGWGFCGFFRICGFFFSSSNLPHFCRFLQFRALIREREKCGINAYKITLTEPQREMRKNCSQKISLTEPQLCEPLDCERHGQCALSFC